MLIVKEILGDYKEDYQKALNLIREECKNDPLDEPCGPLHAAKELLLGMQENLENVLASILAEETEDAKETFTYKVLLAYVLKNLGYIYAKTKEPTLGEKCLRRCIELIEPHKMHPEAVIPYIEALCELGNVLENAEKLQEALKWLKLAEQVYNDFKAIENVEAISINDLFESPEELEKGESGQKLKNLHTMCTFYLALVYGKLNEYKPFTTYCHNALRQLELEFNLFKPIDIFLCVSSLSPCFLEQNMFKEARHYLALASSIMAEYEANMITPEMSESTIDDMKETFKRHYADLARYWANYGLALLNASKEHLSPKKDAKSMNENQSRTNEDSNEFRFSNLKLEVYENRVSTKFCLNLDDAKLIFEFVINWLDQAKSYYKLDTKPTEYAGIMKNYAELYENMAFFEKDPLAQVKMQKRRAKYYEELVDVLNPTDYLMICRECWHGAGAAYSMILVIFLDQKNPSPSLLEKINQVFKKTIKNNVKLIKSYMENDCITFKSNLSTKEIHAVLYTHFYVGSLYFKMVVPDPHLHLANIVNSYKYIKRFTDGCHKHKEAAETLQNEIRICKELVAILANKMQIYRFLTQCTNVFD